MSLSFAQANAPALMDSLNAFETAGPVFEFDTLAIQWDGISWTHSKGSLQWLTPVRGKPTGALICGRGHFAFLPKLKPERDLLKRTLGSAEIEGSCDGLVLRFTPEIGEALLAGKTFREVGARVSCRDLMSPAEDEWRRPTNIAIAPKIARAFLDESPALVLYGRVISKEHGELIYLYDGRDAESVKLLSRAEHFEDLQILSSFAPKSESVYELPLWNDSADAVISNYSMTVTIPEQGGMRIRGTLQLQATRAGTRVVAMRLHPKMRILSLADENGEEIAVWRKKHLWAWDDEVYLVTRQALPVNRDTHWDFEIEGEALERVYGHFYLDARLDWYPISGYLREADYDVLFEYPKYYDLVAVGEKIEETVDKGTKRARWKAQKKPVGMSFFIGEFRTSELGREGLPPITLCQADVASPELKHYLQSQGVSVAGRSGKELANEVVDALSFYTELLGPCLAKHIYVTEILGQHGQGLSGLIQLSWLTFATHDDWGINRAFRAHEVAHQWWGEGIGWESYHDQWLSEGFAEYCAWWILQTKEGNKLFFKRLDKARDNIVHARDYLLAKGPSAPSLWLGWRASTTETRGDYFRLTYEKGAWVLHMLRNLLIDFQTMNEDKFKTVLREFYQRFQGQRANTEDFRKVLEEVTGESFHWFFDQWVYGADIPTYRWNYAKRKEGDYWRVALEVQQEGVPSDFHMPVPVTLKFKDGTRATVRIEVRGEQESYELPRMKQEPVEVSFNDYSSVLCELKRK
ncbi:MAG: M1 family aminopeptidase [bacterium]